MSSYYCIQKLKLLYECYILFLIQMQIYIYTYVYTNKFASFLFVFFGVYPLFSIKKVYIYYLFY